jgi:putative membrane protein
MYLYVKALHVFAVVILIGGMLAIALALRIAMAASDEREARRFGDAVLRWDGFVTTPALAVVWMAGFTMAFGAGWSTSPWLLLKMIPAVFLSGLHSLEGMALKRLLQDGKPINPWFKAAPFAILLAFGTVAWLAVVKPF